MNRFKLSYRLFFVVCIIFGLTACDATRDQLGKIGKEPELKQVVPPMEEPSYKPVAWHHPEE